jgi:hypothetical protein
MALVLSTHNSLALWDALPLLQYLEFPWRALVLAAFSTAVIAALPVLAVPAPRRRWLLAVILLALVFTGVPRARPEEYYDIRDSDYAPEVIAAAGIAVTTTREYEPRCASWKARSWGCTTTG